MRIEPQFDVVARHLDRGETTVVWTTLVADLETPVSAFLKLSANRDHCILLESVEGGATRGRYSVIGLDPDLVFRAHGAACEINDRFHIDRHAFQPVEANSLEAIRALIKDNQYDVPAGLPPMAAGIFGYLGYDMVRQMERLPEPNRDTLGTPDAILVRPRIMLVFDAVRDEITIVSPVRPEPGVSADRIHARAVERLISVVDALDEALDKSVASQEVPLDVPVISNTAPEVYASMVARAKEYIAAGDIFQVVLSQRFEAPFTLPPISFYRALRRVNPAPFLYYLNFGGFSIVGSSPEILVRVRDNEVTIRPIAGTRPRGKTPAEDKANAAELLADPKELAEHLMLLDLGRNDVGRVAKIGSVKVTDKFFLEYYSQVMHIVSNVTGQLDTARHDALDALAAGFPAGTVSGAPKVRAMEIIDELEQEKRGIYAGCVGYFSADGNVDTCICLRTAVIKNDRMYVQAGAGIVADSVPEMEQAECVNKAKALFRAAEEAVRFSATANRGQ
ncbi:MAG: anthranilate synthase component I [Hyphomicrobiaceae bacterium]|nr:anthranilate synthase component I [Hyphomicrobiaceae bacterium]